MRHRQAIMHRVAEHYGNADSRLCWFRRIKLLEDVHPLTTSPPTPFFSCKHMRCCRAVRRVASAVNSKAVATNSAVDSWTCSEITRGCSVLSCVPARSAKQLRKKKKLIAEKATRGKRTEQNRGLPSFIGEKKKYPDEFFFR